jgi:hypothetical protein
VTPAAEHVAGKMTPERRALDATHARLPALRASRAMRALRSASDVAATTKKKPVADSSLYSMGVHFTAPSSMSLSRRSFT